jgi:hypothetical protein
MLVGADVGIEQPDLAVFDQAVRILEVGVASADRFHLSSGKNQSALKFFQQEIVM